MEDEEEPEAVSPPPLPFRKLQFGFPSPSIRNLKPEEEQGGGGGEKRVELLQRADSEEKRGGDCLSQQVTGEKNASKTDVVSHRNVFISHVIVCRQTICFQHQIKY